MKTIACQCVWWKTINKDINSCSKRCERCCKAKSHVKSQWNPWPEETEKWHRVHADIVGTFENDRYALIIVDAYTKWPEVHIMTSTTSSEVKKRWRRKLSQEGVSVILVTDNGLKFVSKELDNWLSAIRCSHMRIPPYHPRSNGIAERFLRALKDHVRAVGILTYFQIAVDRFLLQYRNARHNSTGVTPAIRIQGQLLKSLVVALSVVGDKIWV